MTYDVQQPFLYSTVFESLTGRALPDWYLPMVGIALGLMIMYGLYRLLGRLGKGHPLILILLRAPEFLILILMASLTFAFSLALPWVGLFCGLLGCGIAYLFTRSVD